MDRLPPVEAGDLRTLLASLTEALAMADRFGLQRIAIDISSAYDRTLALLVAAVGDAANDVG